MKRSLLSLLACSFALAIGPAAALLHAAEPTLTFPDASPLAVVQQRIGITDIEVTYHRPGMHGRQIFGSLVPYDQTWRTGANNATKVSFSTPVKLNGQDLAAGTYELFTIPSQSEWTVIIHKNMSQWGDYSYDAKNDVLRVKAKASISPTSVETMTIGFGDLTATTATLYIDWERVRVPVTITVDVVGMMKPKIDAAMAASGGKKPYVEAAMFYYENNVELKQALTWMDAALAENPKAFWLTYRKGLILAKMGDKAGALAAANASLVLANEAKGSMKAEYVRLNQALIASVK